MSLRSLWMSILILSLHGGAGSDEEVSGAAGGTVTLPCTYDATYRRTNMCWGRGECSTLECNGRIIRTDPDGLRVTWGKSNRYQLLGDIAGRDVSLTIRNITKKDEGKYCCRVEIPGPFNDQIHYINLKVQQGGAGSGEEVSGAEGGTVTLPCTYNATYRRTDMCWGRGECSYSGCKNEIIRTDPDGSSVTRRTSNRYQLLGDIAGGDVSLTISRLTQEDGGKYCCRVKISGPFNDQKNNIVLKVLEGGAGSGEEVSGAEGGTVTLPCTYDATYKRTSMCWGRGKCSYSGCKNEIILTDGSSVTKNTSNRYQLLGDIAGGDVSLTISRLTQEDEGTYCCRVKISGPFNDQKNNIVLKVLEAKTSNPRTASSVRDDTYESGNNEFGENDHKSTDETPNARTTSSAQDYSSKSGNNELDNNVSTEGSGDHSSPTSVTPVKKTPSARSAPASSPAVYIIIPIVALIGIFITGMAYRYMKTNKGSASAGPVVGLKAADSTNRTEDNVYIIQ